MDPIWLVEKIGFNDKALDQYLSSGWEPFAVIKDPCDHYGFVIFLRKIEYS